MEGGSENNERTEAIYTGPDENGLRKVSVSLYLGPPLDEKLVKHPCGRPPIQYELYQILGLITMSWGGIEIRHDELIRSILKERPELHVDGWERLNFRKRREQCRKMIKEFFGGTAPSISEYLLKTLDLAAELYWKRNLLVHGEVSSYLGIGLGTEITRFGIKASGRHNGKEISLILFPSDLNIIYYELMHCYGRLDFLTGHEITNNPLLDAADLQRLRDFAIRNNMKANEGLNIVFGPKPVSIKFE